MKGTSIGNYQIVSDLGSGEIGEVYYAEDKKLGRRAAVKFLRPKLTVDDKLIDRFFAEARAINKLRHPNIVEITDFGEVDNRHYIMMELLEGETLAERLERARPIPLDAALAVVRQVAAALAAAHQQNIVHADVKPENIFLTNRPGAPNSVKVLDFGIRVFFRGSPDPARDPRCESVSGTLAYMAPEQFRDAATTDPRTDVYSLGIVAYEMLTGRLPFQTESDRQIIEAHLEASPPPAHEVNPELPESVDRFFRFALAKDARERFRNIDEMVAALDHITDPETFPLDSIRPEDLFGPDEALDNPARRLDPGAAGRIGSRLGDIVIQRIKEDRLQLPSIPRSIARALQILDSPAVNFQSVSETLEQDPILAPQLLRVANSPLYLGVRPAKTIEEAVRRLGFDELRVLMTELAAHKVFTSPNPKIRRAFHGLQQHSVAVAGAAREISKLVSVDGDHAGAYIAGLLHDVGKPIFGSMLLEAEKAMYRKHQVGELFWMTDEEWLETVEHSHSEVGSELARRWNLPHLVVQAVRKQPYDVATPTSISNIVRLANAIAKREGFDVGEPRGDSRQEEVDSGIKLLGLPEGTFARVQDLLRRLPSAGQ